MQARIIKERDQYKVQYQQTAFPFGLGPIKWFYVTNIAEGVWSSSSYEEALKVIEKFKGNGSEIVFETSF